MRPTLATAACSRSALLGFLAVLFVLFPAQAHSYLSLVRQGVESTGVPNSGDHFGQFLATGDFNNDGFDDLATASPWEANGLINTAAHGLVSINWGGPFGLRNTGAAELSPGAPADNSIKFGQAMAVGDFNGDGFDDLAVGLPGNDEGTFINAGGVWIYDGFAGGLQLAPSLMLAQSDVGSTPGDDENFGFTLAVGDFDASGHDDLAITTLGENGSAGQVTIVYSAGAAGLAPATAAGFTPDMFAGSVEIAGSWFGKALATGDLDGDGRDDLVIGAPRTSPVGLTAGGSGRIYVLYGSQVGLSTTDSWSWDATAFGNLPDVSLELGWSLAVGNFTLPLQSGPVQIMVGAPGYEEGGQNDTGAVVMVSHDDNGRGTGGETRVYKPSAVLALDAVDPNDRFGATLAADEFDGDGFADLAVGVVSNNVAEQISLGPQADAGSVYLYGGSPAFGLIKRITHKVLNDHIYAGDNLGRGLAFGDFDNRGRSALAIGAPWAEYFSYDGGSTIANAGRVYIHAPWRQPRNRPHRGSAAFDCEGNLIYAQRAWQRMRPASTTKTMTLKVVCDFLDQGQDPGQWMTIPDWVANNVGGSQAGHLTGDRLRFFDLLKTMMTVSGNDSAMYLAALVSGEGLNEWSGWANQSPGFAADMETQAGLWGLSSVTSFTNAAGIDAGDHYTTPIDFAQLAYQAINEPCVKQIVNQPNWIVPVQRLGLGGSPGVYGVINLKFTNGFVNAVRNQNPSAVGMKGGQTPGALRTGVYNSYVTLAAAHNAASGFGVWDNGIPLPLTVADCNSCLGAELLAIADLYCLDAAFPDEILAPDPQPGPWAVLQGMSSAADDTASGLVFNAVGSEANSLGRQIQVDILRANQAWPTAEVIALLRHTSEFCLPAGASDNVGVLPYQQHDGFRITNRGTRSVDLLLEATDPAAFAVQVTLAPDSSYALAATDGSQPAPAFMLTITNQSSALEACLEVQEIGYRSLVSLGSGGETSDVASFFLERSLATTDETWSLEFRGLDTTPGNLLDISAHDTQNVSAVDDGGGHLPPPRPLNSRLLPNVPNPFNPVTRIRFDLSFGGEVSLRVFDARGRLVRTLAAGTVLSQGRHTVVWDGRDDSGRNLASGVYHVLLKTAGQTDSQRVVLLK